MRTLITPLLQPFAIVEHPVRFFILFFLMALGFVHLISEISILFSNGLFTDGPRMTLMIIVLSLLVSISRYYEQKRKKEKPISGIAA